MSRRGFGGIAWAGVILGLLACNGIVQAGGECDLIETSHVVASDAASFDFFGRSVAISGNTAVVGAPGDDGPLGPVGAKQGSAYVFVRNANAWTQEAKLTASDSEAFDRFGWSVAVAGDTAIVGAPNVHGPAGASQGAAFVFVRTGSTWTQQAKLTASDAAALDLFGCSVAVNDDTTIIGAFADDGPAGSSQGSVYVFVRSGTEWTQQAKLTASDAAALDRFGHNVAISAGTIIVSAPLHDGPAALNQGSAYVFAWAGTKWVQQAKLTAPDAAATDFFGTSVAIAADTAIVGAYGDDGPAGLDQGSAYIFVRHAGTWTEQTKLTASDPAADDFFGWSVALAGDLAIVGASSTHGPTGRKQGAVYVFHGNEGTWTETAELTPSAAGSSGAFGDSVAISGDTAIVGDVAEDGPAEIDHGSAYLFECAPVFADLNGDDVVDSLDLDMLLSGWSIPATVPGCGGMVPCPADINGDGVVNTLDLGILLSHWTL